MDDTISATTASGPAAPCFAAFGDLRAPAVGDPDLSLLLPAVVLCSLLELVLLLLELQEAASAPAACCCAVLTACGCLSLSLLLLLLDETPA
jgi:hypothetical protein